MGNDYKIRGLGPKTAVKLDRLGIHTATDLLHHYPSRYIDFSKISKISEISSESSATVRGTLVDFQNIFTRSRKNIQKAILRDSTGQINLVWFNQPYLAKTLQKGHVYTFAGTVTSYRNTLTIITPTKLTSQEGQILPIYPETKGLTSAWFRRALSANIDHLVEGMVDPVPPPILNKYRLLNLPLALKEIHVPTTPTKLTSATRRLGLHEILSLQSLSLLSRQQWAVKTPPVRFKETTKIAAKINKFITALPFALTPSQAKAWSEIRADLLSANSANRLLQGDVGSGKTVLAILACYLAHLNGSTSLLIAPTEILARQHYATFKKLLKIPLRYLSGTATTGLSKIPPGSVIISTHAAIYRKSSLPADIGLLIIDEQHKFGVRQRSFLTDTLHPPHCLTMTATPIPRTVSLTLMGNLDLTTLDTIPAGRLPVKTFLVPAHKYFDCYRWLENHLTRTGEQAFIVCPFIEISETMATVKSAVEVFEHLQTVFPDLRLDLIHGRIPADRRQTILKSFADRKTNILVSTPMIEVGIDFPNATTIIIQSADRFGLAQLHQLRGRVGRSSLQSYCYLFAQSASDQAVSRLKFLERTHDGQKIALFDLKTRGPGELFSYIQHGFPSLRLANLSDYELISLGQKIITEITASYPDFDFKKFIFDTDFSLSTTN